LIGGEDEVRVAIRIIEGDMIVERTLLVAERGEDFGVKLLSFRKLRGSDEEGSKKSHPAGSADEVSANLKKAILDAHSLVTHKYSEGHPACYRRRLEPVREGAGPIDWDDEPPSRTLRFSAPGLDGEI
jgi:hypothetical protein